MKQFLIPIVVTVIAFFIWFVTNSYYYNLIKQTQYQEWYNKWYDAWMCAIVRTVTWRPKCEVKELQTGSGKTRKAAISLPE